MYVNFIPAILYSGAGFDIVSRSFVAVASIGLIFFAWRSSVFAEPWR